MKNLINKLLALLCVCALFLSSFSVYYAEAKDNYIWDGTIAENFSGGDGTKANPFIISTPEEFALFWHCARYDKVQFENGDGIYADFSAGYLSVCNYKISDDLYFNDVSTYTKWATKKPQNTSFGDEPDWSEYTSHVTWATRR